MGHIEVEFRDSLGDWDGPPSAAIAVSVADVLPIFDDGRYPLLRLVDPYGDTVFSSHQMAGVLPELGALHRETEDPLVVQIIRLAERCRDAPHSWLVFLGD